MKRAPALLLAACVVGLALCPAAYVVTGALSGFAPAFAAIALPPYAVAASFLLMRFLARPGVRKSSGVLLVIAEVGAWLVIALLTYVLSGVNLLVGIERGGTAALLFLTTSAAVVPILALRRTALEQRIAHWRRGRVIVALLVLLAAAFTVAALHLARPPRFPG